MELRFVTGIGFSKTLAADGSVSVYIAQAEGTPAIKHPRAIKIGHYFPSSKTLHLGDAVLPENRHTDETGDLKKYDWMPFADVLEHQSREAGYADQRKQPAAETDDEVVEETVEETIKTGDTTNDGGDGILSDEAYAAAFSAKLKELLLAGGYEGDNADEIVGDAAKEACEDRDPDSDPVAEATAYFEQSEHA